VRDFVGAIAEAMRNEYRRGRKHTELAREINVSPRTVSAIVLHDRKIGAKTLRAIFQARPPWLVPVLLQALHDNYGYQVEFRKNLLGPKGDEAGHGYGAAGGDGFLPRG
jgi:hypothetical protein